MLPLMPQLVVAMATGLGGWEGPRNALVVDVDRELSEGTRTEANLRFVDFVGFWSHFAFDAECSSWPLPETTDIEELADFAEEHRVLVPGALAGDVYLGSSPRRDRYVSAGIITSVERVIVLPSGNILYECKTVEGELYETADPVEPRSVEGASASLITTARLTKRRLAPALGDCFIRWSDLAPRTSR